jgi:hypothetical protein
MHMSVSTQLRDMIFVVGGGAKKLLAEEVLVQAF